MFSSTIIPTIARPLLARAVESVLAQDFSAEDFEIIVVNDSGRPLPQASWQKSDRVRVVETNHRERCVTRNTGAAVARGRYLHFLDDDDWVRPNALQTFWELSRRKEGGWLYGASQLTDRQGQPLIVLRHQLEGNCFVQIMSGEWIPLQASIISAEVFFKVGGFSPRIKNHEDVDFCRRVALAAGFAGTDEIVAVVGMGSEGSTSDHGEGRVHSRWARESILNEPGVFRRLRASAADAAWQGRISRIYFSSLAWNLPRRNFLTAASRGLFGLANMALSGPQALTPAFWASLRRPYTSETFARGFREAGITAGAALPAGSPASNS